MYLKFYSRIQPDTVYIYGLLKKNPKTKSNSQVFGWHKSVQFHKTINYTLSLTTWLIFTLSQCQGVKLTPKLKELSGLKTFLCNWLKFLYYWANSFGKILVHISANMKLIKAPLPSAGKSNAQIDSGVGSSLGNHYEIIILKVGDLG